MSALAPPEVEALFRRHERLLWGLAYRMLGSAADADEVLQETFLRLLERPPPDDAAPLRPWLVRVAVNLSRDRLRRRKVRGYVGPWLPGAVDTARLRDDLPQPEAPAGEQPEVRYERLESASYAFLLALEALTSRQRAVLLLRDVLGQDVRETAAALALSPDNVKTTHLRARRALEGYDRARRPLDAARHEEALGRFALALQAGDAPALLALLAPGVVGLSDGGGEFHAALRPLQGPWRVAAFFLGLARKQVRAPQVELLSVNGLPALLVEVTRRAPKIAPRTLIRLELAPDGRVGAVHVVLASRKLVGLGSARAD